MLAIMNHDLFLVMNAPSHPNAVTVAFAEFAASWLVYAAVALVPALWIWGRPGERAALLATTLGVSVALGMNQLLGLVWFEPRPFMIGLGHTLTFHIVENSFPSDHATFLWSLGFSLVFTGAARRWGAMVCIAGALVAWARVYLGLHFPIDMAASFLVAVVGGTLASAIVTMSRRWLQPDADRLYGNVLRLLHLPPALFPHQPQQQQSAFSPASHE